MVVLITVENGTADYVTAGDVHVVMVDFDHLAKPDTFIEDIDLAIDQVRDLTADVPWRGGVLRRLSELRKQRKEELEL